MLLAIDVGNTHTVIGLFQNTDLLWDWRIRTERNMTEDEFKVLLTSLFTQNGIQLARIRQSVISCVVPPLVGVLEAFCRKYLHHGPLWVNAETAAGMPILYRNPFEVGADRLVNAVAAYESYHTSLIVIDFGTATTFDVISEKGEYLGGAISPGILTASEALYQNASKLPRIEIFTPPPNVIGKTTEESMKAGVIFGYAALVDGIVNRMKKEIKSDPRVIATGGLAPLMANVSETIEAVEPDLTLQGLRIISAGYSRQKDNGASAPRPAPEKNT